MNATHDQRRQDLAKIHIAKKDLRMDDETYRQMLWTVARVDSASKLDDAGRQAVLDHCKSLGWRPRRGRRPRPAADKHKLLKKIDAQLGDRPRSYADGMARKMFRVERVDWCTPDQLRRIVAALNYDARRHRQ